MEKEEKINLFRIITTIILFAITFIPSLNSNIKISLYIISYLVIGGDILINAIKNIFKGELFDENFLMSLATVGALVIGEYPEAIAVMLFYQIGELFQDMAVEKSKANITKLMDIRPDFANIEHNGNLVQVSPEKINIGDIIVVKPGEKIPLDGIIVYGKSSLNTTALTGESIPRSVNVDDEVLSGCINLSCLIKIKTTSTFGDSTVSKILDLVENADNSKANTEKFITKFAKIYTPVVVILAVLLAVIPSLITGEWLEWINRSLIFLVISCPCALVVSVPLSFFAGIGGASKNGVLIKGANYLEALANVNTIVFDKTGTLTKGNFKVVAIHPEKITEEKLLEIATLAEQFSTHPISISLKNEYSKELDKNRVKDIEDIPGKGIKATVDKKQVYIGNDNLMKYIDVHYENCEKEGTISHIVIDGEYAGHIVITDEIKPTSKTALNELKNLGVAKTVMLTGDKKEVGESIGFELGLDEIKTELLPVNKVEEVERLIKSKNNDKEKIAFVGDGINDAPVLKRCDIGISMGGLGSDAAIEASDIVLMNDDPSSIAKAIKISRKTLKIVRQNIIFALAVKLIVLILGALGIANMWEAVFADVGVSFIAILNALRCIKD